jgi:hypothetical protein
MADHRSPARGTGIRNFMKRFMHATWHRLFVHEGRT